MIARDPRANIRSVLNRLSLPGDAETVEAVRSPDLDSAWYLAFDAEALGLDGDTYIAVAAERWNQAADAYLDHRDEMVLVRYEDFVEDKVEVIAGLAEQLQLPPATDIADSVDRQFQPPGNSQVDWRTFFGERNLSHIETICASRMAHFGYEPTLGSTP